MKKLFYPFMEGLSIGEQWKRYKQQYVGHYDWCDSPTDTYVFLDQRIFSEGGIIDVLFS